MDNIIIPFTLDPHQGLELRYALRSIDMYFPENDVLLIGDKPRWYKGDHLQAGDTHCRKEYSIMQKVLLAPFDNFIMFNDDHFALQSGEIKYWNDGPLEDLLKRGAKGYGATIRNTLELYPDALNYDIHTPIVFNRETLHRLAGDLQKEYCLKTVYCTGAGIRGEYMEDMKINAPLSAARIREKIAGRVFFSSGPHALVGDMVEVLGELYPTPSKWEK